MDTVIVLYGSTGYTGQLIAKEFKKAGIEIVLSGRNEQKLKAQSEEVGFDYLAVDLYDSTLLKRMLEEVDILINAAGPFSKTAKPMVEACLETGTHYLDITGEIEVFQDLHLMDSKAKDNNILLLPGIGFDVVPTDCLASFLKEQMPDANELNLFIGGFGRVSPGTAKTAVEAASKRVRARRDGMLVFLNKPIEKTFEFGEGSSDAISVSWGDVATAYYTTGIPNVTVYFQANKKLKERMKTNAFRRWIISLPFIQNMIKRKIEKSIAGPNEEERKKGYSLIFGEVKDKIGKVGIAKLHTPEGYSLTAKLSVIIARKLIDSEIKTGFYTPAKYFGPDLIMEVEGVQREIVNSN